MGCVKSTLNKKIKQNENLLEKCKHQTKFQFREQQFLTLLPPEMWDLVLKKIHDPAHLLNCCEASSTWNTLLEDRKPTMYFHLTLPSLLPYLSKSDLLRCCQVSRLWGKAVDICIDETNVERIHWIPLKIRNTHRENYLNIFLGRFNVSNSSPPVNLLMYRNVFLSYHKLTGRTDNPQHDLDLMLHRLDKFLKKFGNLVRNLRLQLTWTAPEFGDIATLIRKWLQYMPNLRKLELEITWSSLSREENQGQRDDSFGEHLSLLPDLPHLTYFKINSKISQIVELLLVRYGASLEHMDVLKYGIYGTPAPCETSFPHLQHLEIRIHSMICLKRFYAFSNAYQLKLKKLVVTISLGTKPKFAAKYIETVCLLHPELKEFYLRTVNRSGFVREYTHIAYMNKFVLF